MSGSPVQLESPRQSNGYINGNFTDGIGFSVFDEHFSSTQQRKRQSRSATRSGRASPAHSAHGVLIRTSIVKTQDDRKAKKLKFYRNGDAYFKGSVVAFSVERYRTFESLLGSLTELLTDKVNLPAGVRYIFSTNGTKVTSLEQLLENSSYVCASGDKFCRLDYEKIAPMTPTRVRNGGSQVWLGRETPSSEKSSEDSRDFIKPKLVTVIRNGVKPRKAVRVLLNKKTAHSFEQVLTDITNAIKLDTGAVRKLFTVDGRPVTCLADFFREDDIFIAYGKERAYHDDFDLDNNESKYVTGRTGNSSSRGSSRQRIGQKSPGTPRRRVGNTNNTNGNHMQAVVAAPMSPVRHIYPTSPKSPRRVKNPASLSHTPRNNVQNGNYEAIGGVIDCPPEICTCYEIGRVIGDGNFAVVRECVDRKTGKEYALKIIDKMKCKGKEQMIENEVEILRRVKHPNIVLLLEEFDTSTQLFMVMELVKGGDLFDAISSSTKYTERDASGMMYNLASALHYLHSLNVVHRDIKPENLLVYEHADHSKSLKLGDFGLAVELQQQHDRACPTTTAGSGGLTTVCGTPTYVAPEILAEVGYGLKVDVWAAGVITYILLCGFPPFVSAHNTQDELFDLILAGDFEFTAPYWDDISQSAKQLIMHMLQVDPDNRYSAEEFLNHPWVADDEALDNDMHVTVSRKLSMHFHRLNATAAPHSPSNTAASNQATVINNQNRRRQAGVQLITNTALDKEKQYFMGRGGGGCMVAGMVVSGNNGAMLSGDSLDSLSDHSNHSARVSRDLSPNMHRQQQPPDHLNF